MRVLGASSGNAAQGALTDAGEIVGEVTYLAGRVAFRGRLRGLLGRASVQIVGRVVIAVAVVLAAMSCVRAIVDIATG